MFFLPIFFQAFQVREFLCFREGFFNRFKNGRSRPNQRSFFFRYERAGGKCLPLSNVAWGLPYLAPISLLGNARLDTLLRSIKPP